MNIHRCYLRLHLVADGAIIHVYTQIEPSCMNIQRCYLRPHLGAATDSISYRPRAGATSSERIEGIIVHDSYFNALADGTKKYEGRTWAKKWDCPPGVEVEFVCKGTGQKMIMQTASKPERFQNCEDMLTGRVESFLPGVSDLAAACAIYRGFPFFKLAETKTGIVAIEVKPCVPKAMAGAALNDDDPLSSLASKEVLEGVGETGGEGGRPNSFKSFRIPSHPFKSF